MKNNSNKRIRITSVLIIIFTLVIISRLYSLQIIQGDDFRDQADRQYVSAPVNTFDRGSIFFQDKDGDLVSSGTLLSGYYLAIVPRDIEFPEDSYNLLSSVIDLDEEDFIRKASKENDPFEEIAHRLTEDQAAAITALDIDAVRLYREKWRYYPFDELSSHSIGFVAYKDDVLSGRYGLEREYDSLLTRSSDSSKVNFFADVFLNLKDNLFSDSESGDLVTTIEPAVQAFLGDALNTVQSTYKSKLTGGIIINPNNGEIYALDVRPTFDLNKFNTVESPDVFSNPLVEHVYEMGSIMKSLTMASGLDSDAITTESTYFDTGSVTYNESRISNYDGRARGADTTIQDILSQSLNVGVAWIVEEMGIENFSSYFKAFSFDEPVGIDLPNETGGLDNNLDSDLLIDQVTASYGQGIALTPIAAARALSSLANGGELITPHIGKEIKLRSGLTKEIKQPAKKRVFKKETTDEVTEMLIKVVDEALKGGNVKLENYTIAAKTGTAQIADNQNGGYYTDKYLHSFFGYFPARDPEFLVFLYTVEPQKVQYASETLTESFMEITKFLLNYYEVTPDRNI
jgi:cell division protein FtsI/penicillin-binding protein 2